MGPDTNARALTNPLVTEACGFCCLDDPNPTPRLPWADLRLDLLSRPPADLASRAGRVISRALYNIKQLPCGTQGGAGIMGETHGAD